jgi:hypothetical protein
MPGIHHCDRTLVPSRQFDRHDDVSLAGGIDDQRRVVLEDDVEA